MLLWYRRFISDFSSIVAPLTPLTSRNTPFQWTTQCEDAFKIINFTHSFILQTDASTLGLGAVVTQFYADQEHVIC